MIYIVEDDPDIRELERYALKNSGYEVLGFHDSRQFYKAMEQTLPELILLDIMLPGEDGISILKRLRESEKTAEIPVIMVTAKTTELDKVKGLDTGADDYITKPFGVMELVSRVRALLRRVREKPQAQILSCGTIEIDDAKHQVSVNRTPCQLTHKEYELLKYLMQNSGIVLTRARIMDHVWGFDFAGESRTVDMHIKTLRQKLGEGGEAIKTIRNVGYRIGD